MGSGKSEKGFLMLVKLWNDNRKSIDYDVSERAKDMLLNAFESPQEMMLYMKKHNIN